MGERARLRGHGHRLARDEPALIAVLAAPRVPHDVPAVAPPHRIRSEARVGRWRSVPFKGWPVEALEFFEGLEEDNSKAYRQRNKTVYETCVRAPMEG